jgi:hypothetical protein
MEEHLCIHSAVNLDEACGHSGPLRMGAGAEPRAVVTVGIFVEQYVVTKLRFRAVITDPGTSGFLLLRALQKVARDDVRNQPQ